MDPSGNILKTQQFGEQSATGTRFVTEGYEGVPMKDSVVLDGTADASVSKRPEIPIYLELQKTTIPSLEMPANNLDSAIKIDMPQKGLWGQICMVLDSALGKCGHGLLGLFTKPSFDPLRIAETAKEALNLGQKAQKTNSEDCNEIYKHYLNLICKESKGQDEGKLAGVALKSSKKMDNYFYESFINEYALEMLANMEQKPIDKKIAELGEKIIKLMKEKDFSSKYFKPAIREILKELLVLCDKAKAGKINRDLKFFNSLADNTYMEIILEKFQELQR